MLDALVQILQPSTMLILVLGTAGGIFLGALPGIGVVTSVALVLPFTFSLSPLVGLVFLLAIYNGATYGGSITAILFRTPGTPSNIVTVFDGFPMNQQGQGGLALRLSAYSSFIGGLIGLLAFVLLAPPLARFALVFGPLEYFFLAIFGLSFVASATGGNLWKSLIPGFLGLWLGTVGQDPTTGYFRYTFDEPSLYTGVPVVPVIIGLFSLSQAMELASKPWAEIAGSDVTLSRAAVPFSWYWKKWISFLRSGVIGTIAGILPGVGATIACYAAYNEEKRVSPDPSQFGKGAPEGVIASETANNAVVGGSLVPLLTLGIPGNEVTAVMLGGFLLVGLQPGPQLFKNTALVNGLIAGLFVVLIVTLIFGLSTARYFSYAATIPNFLLAPIIAILCVVGAYGFRNNGFDVALMLVAGLVGLWMDRMGFSMAILVLGLILGPIAERQLRISLRMTDDIVALFWSSPIAISLATLSLIFLLWPVVRGWRKERVSKAA